jgi:hypothetical protein
MNGVAVRSSWLWVLCLCCCGGSDKPSLPPALPVVVPVAARANEPAEAAPTHNPVDEHASSSRSKAKPGASKPARSTTSKPRRDLIYEPPAAPVAPPAPAAPTPAPVARAPVVTPPPAPVVAKRVSVPRTEHVHVELPAGLQGDLDADPRMQKWVDRVIAIADGCHARNRAATGTLEAQVTMHENERPSASLRSLPGQLSGLVSCATGALMGVKMPLFTGREGTRYTVRIVIE